MVWMFQRLTGPQSSSLHETGNWSKQNRHPVRSSNLSIMCRGPFFEFQLWCGAALTNITQTRWATSFKMAVDTEPRTADQRLQSDKRMTCPNCHRIGSLFSTMRPHSLSSSAGYPTPDCFY